MIEILEWLLDLEHIRLGRGAPLILKWVGEVPAWLLLCAAVALGALVVLACRRERGSAGRRIILGSLRCATIALVVAVICQPTLVLPQDRVEPSYAVVLLDTSQSMTTREVYQEPSLAGAIARGAGLETPGDLPTLSRLELVQRALTRNDAAALKRLVEGNSLQLSTFAGAAETQGFAESVEAIDALARQIDGVVADGPSTNLPGAIEQVVKKAGGRRLAAIVLVTDGQSTEPVSLEPALDLAGDRQIPIYPLRFGSPERVRDIEVGPLRAEESVFLHDVLAVEARVVAYGLAEPTTVSVRLVDERDSTKPRVIRVQEVVLDPGDAATMVELRTKPARPGRARYRVEAGPLPGERVTDNNTDRVEVNVIEDKLRVLYVEGYPRYEYRYLKNALLREKTVELSVLLLEADEAFVQEGTVPIRRFPRSPEELNRYDVVLFGDVDLRGGWLSDAQMDMLVDYVGHRGGGFALIAGERAVPHKLRGTPLEKLIPVRIDPDFLGHYHGTLQTGFRPRLTPEGRRSRFFELTPAKTSKWPYAKTGKRENRERSKRANGQTVEGVSLELEGARRHGPMDDLHGESVLRAETGSSSNASTMEDAPRRTEGPFETLPDLFWVARTLGAKPGATVLVEHPTLRTPGSTGSGVEPMPVVVTGRYGAGKVFFQATDDTWRWRRHRMSGQSAGPLFHDTYWVQVARMLSQPQRAAQDRRFTIRTDRRVYAYGQGVRASVEIFDIRLLSEQGDTIAMTLRDYETSSVVGRFEVHRLGPESSKFEGGYVPPRMGGVSVRADDLAPPPGERPVSALIRVERPDLEARRPEADHGVLQRIAVRTRGRVIGLDQLETEFARIEDRSTRIPDDITEPLWDSKLILILFVLMISTEWILRKAFGLL